MSVHLPAAALLPTEHFDAAAVRNPADPATLDPRLAGPDNLHPNPAGYRAMADAVDLTALHGCA
ncbi:hypothetical protein [Nocardia yunnanensis]|uniref:hypothetical protein n=1 Tax=Nocardia yunnanensis TaxID=2382165 RepID=UPI00165694B3|nr:hypothetical protein [Nocardia yunnanensis]